MRERISAVVSAIAVVLLVGLSAVFARSQNPPGAEGPAGVTGEGAAEETVAETPAERTGEAAPTASPVAAVTEPAAQTPVAADSARGRAVFVANNCMRCHAVAGEGNARNPLDGIGARRTPEQLRAWTVGAEVLADSLSPSAYRAKQAYQEIPAADLDALILYLASLKRPPGSD